MKTAGDPVAAVDDRRPERQDTVPPSHAAAPTPSPAGNLRDFLDELLTEQSRLDTPAARASHAYDRAKSWDSKSKIFESLLPLSRPRAGEQYAFEVDLDACSGCKACVSACHALNGLDENETWRDTGQLLGCSSSAPVAQTITTACHHCEDPGCLNGCPVLAYEKDPLTGIVRHLDDQCIGCQYCILKCPYDVPKYNARLGIVRKCDLCHQRLAHGEAPACAQACPTQAIRVVVVSTGKSVVAAPRNSRSAAHASKPGLAEDSGDRPHSSAADSEKSSSAQRLSEIENRKSKIAFPGPDPTYTRPTTCYVTARELPAELRAADAAALRPQHPHWPLILMLTLLPWAICLQALLLTPLGKIAAQQTALVAVPSAWSVIHAPSEFVTYYATTCTGQLALFPLVLGALGLAAATFHLGQPLRAWRVFLGLRTSWFSREAVLFGGWFGLTALAAVFPCQPALTALAAATGLAGLACSVMIYVDTRRTFWRAASTAPRFLLGGALLALATVAQVTAAASDNVAYYATFALAVVGVAKLAVELASLRGDAVSARLQRARFVGVLCVRLGVAIGAVVALALMQIAAEPVTATSATGADLAYYARFAAPLALLLAGEIAERYLFFRAVDAPKMPGYAVR
jgi:Fe-S-cluster-containing dehydrogenase component/DMSO reductase anchor subunit